MTHNMHKYVYTYTPAIPLWNIYPPKVKCIIYDVMSQMCPLVEALTSNIKLLGGGAFGR